MDFSKRLTENAHEVLSHADVLARLGGADYVGTEHLLLGILSSEKSTGGRVLHKFNVDFNKVKTALQLTPKADLSSPLTSIKGFSETAKLTLRMSIELSSDYNQDYCGTEHILFSLLNQKNARAAMVLTELKVDTDGILASLEEYLEKNQNNDHEELAHGRRERQTHGSFLNKFSTNLTAMAQKNELDPVIGREKEIERAITILSRRTKNNPVLIGEAGVGKTAIVEGLAQKIVAGDVPDHLVNKKVFALDLAAMVAGTKYRGEFEDRLKRVLDEVKADRNLIVFIDELHLLVGAGAAEGAMDAANILKPALARGNFHLIGATTMDEYRKHIEKDTALTRRLQTVKVDAPNAKDTVRILTGLAPKYEEHHAVKLSPSVIEEAVRLSERYLPERFQPDKALDVIDEAAARVHIKHSKTEKITEVRQFQDELKQLNAQLEAAVADENYERAALFKMRILRLEEKITDAEKIESNDNKISLKLSDVAVAVATMTGIPIEQLQRSEATRLVNLEKHLSRKIIGQKTAISAVSEAIRRSRVGISDSKRPIGSFIFMGPTGVGKTELARVLAEEVFGSEKNLIKVDMSEFSEKHTASRLVGAPAGYVGYDDGGHLTEKIRRQPYSVVLFDEIEKAHPQIFNLLLQILEDGHLTDGHGKVIDFTNTVIILTSNIGAGQMTRERLGFGLGMDSVIASAAKQSSKNLLNGLPRQINLPRNDNTSDLERTHHKFDNIPKPLRELMRPELLNRFDAIVTFEQLNRGEISQILDLMIDDLNQRLAVKGVGVTLANSARNHLIDRGYDPKFGARPLRRVVQNELENLIAEQLIDRRLTRGDMARAVVKNGELKLEKIHEKTPTKV